MKKALLMLAALLLVLGLSLTCAASADENGQPDEFSLGSHLKETFGIFEDREEIGLTHDDYIGQAWINDYNYWSSTLEGLPVWEVTYSNNAGGVIGSDIWEDSGNSGMSFNLETYPSDHSAISYTVTVTWGNHSASLDGTLSFVPLSPNDLPGGFTVAEADENHVIHLTKGRETTLHFAFDPANFGFSNTSFIGFDFPYWFLEQVGGDGESTWIIRPTEAGYFEGNLMLSHGNVNITQHYYFAVADENGQLNAFSLGSHLKDTFGIFEDREEIGLTHDDYIGQAWIDGYGYWSATLTGLPEWTVTYSNDAGGKIGYEMWEDSGNSGMHFNLSQYPSDHSAISYTVTVTWGNQTASLDGTLSFVPLSSNDLPSGFTVAEADENNVIHLTKDVETELNFAFKPENFDFSNTGFIGFDFPYWFLEQVGGDGEKTWIIRPTEAGYFDGDLMLTRGNVNITQHYYFAVADENGQLNAFSLGGHLKDTFGIFEDREEIGLTHDDYIGQAWINDYNYWSTTLEGLPEWTVTYSNDAGGVIGYEIWQDSGNSGMHFNLSHYPSDQSAIHYTVTVTWGNYSDALDGTLSFVPLSSNDLPSGFTVAEADENHVIHLTKGVETTLHFAFNPSSFHFSNTSFVGFDFPYWFLEQVGGNLESTWIIRPTESGYFDGDLMLSHGNVNITQHYYFAVANENGRLGEFSLNTLDLPQYLSTLEENAFEGVTAQAVTIPDTCTQIGSCAFADCGNLILVDIRARNISIADDAFEGSDPLLVVSTESLYTWAKHNNLRVLYIP